MLMVETSKKFDKDLKILVKNGFDLSFYKVVENLVKERLLNPDIKIVCPTNYPLFRGKI